MAEPDPKIIQVTITDSIAINEALDVVVPMSTTVSKQANPDGLEHA